MQEDLVRRIWEKKMCVSHARYRRIPVQVCHQGCPHKQGNDLKIIIFKNDRKLRSHAVKHFLNLTEEWKGKNLSDQIAALENLGCPFFESGCTPDRPPCNKCSLFGRCTQEISKVEAMYIEALERMLHESGDIPRYACFHSRTENNPVFRSVPEQKFTVKASLLNGDVYNLSTCYHITGISNMKELCDSEVRDIRGEAHPGAIMWCDELSWGLSKEAGHEKKKKRSRKPIKKVRRHRGGGKSFRKLLEGMDEDI